MRKQYSAILKEHFHRHLVRSRQELGLSQEEMAQRLQMDCRNYVELDHGKSCGNALTIAMYLMFVSEDPKGFLQELKEELEKADEAA